MLKPGTDRLHNKGGIRIVLTGIFLIMLFSFPLLGPSKYYLYLVDIVATGAILSLGLNLLLGHCGQANFGMAGFYGIGAYSSMLLMNRLQMNFILTIPISILITTFVGFLIGILMLRLRHFVLALGTFAFATAISATAVTFQGFTGGSDGIFAPRQFLFGHKLGEVFNYYYAISTAVLSYVGSKFLISSRVGRAWKAIREDEEAARALGIHVNRYILLAFIICASYGGLAGTCLTTHTGWIGPESFSVWVNVLILLMVIVGGAGSELGAVVGASLISLLPEILSPWFRYHVIIYAAILFVILRFMPKGLVGTGQDVISVFSRLLRPQSHLKADIKSYN